MIGVNLITNSASAKLGPDFDCDDTTSRLHDLFSLISFLVRDVLLSAEFLNLEISFLCQPIRDEVMM